MVAQPGRRPARPERRSRPAPRVSRPDSARTLPDRWTASLELAVYAVFFLLIGLVFDPSIEVQFTLPKLMWLRFGAAAIIALWALRFVRGEVKAVPRMVLVPATLLVAWWAITTPFAADVRTAVNGMHGRYNGLITQTLLVAVFLAGASTARSRPELRRLALAFVVALVPVAVYAAVQDLGLDPIVWPNPRPGSTLGHPVPLAASMALAIPFVLGFLIVEGRTPLRFVWSSLLLLFGFATAATLSRGPWLGLVVACGIVMVTAVKVRIVNLRGPALWWSLAGVASAGVLLADSSTILHISHRLAQFAQLQADPSFTGRFVFYDAAIRMLGAHPLVGVGLENFGVLYPQYRPLEPETVPPDSIPTMVHNSYIQAAATTGWIGLALNLALTAGVLFGIVQSCRALARRFSAESAEAQSENAVTTASELMLGTAFVGAVAGYIVQSLSGWDEISLTAFYWVLLGAAASFTVAPGLAAVRPAARAKAAVATLAAAAAIALVWLGFDAARAIDLDRVFFQARFLDPGRDWPTVRQALESGLVDAGVDSHYKDAAGLIFLKRVQAAHERAVYERAAELFEDSARTNTFDPYPLIHRIDLDTAGIVAGIVRTPSTAARAAIDRALALDPNNATVYESMATLEQAAGDLTAARHSIDKAIQFRPHHVRYHALRGDLLRALGDRPAAAAAYREEIPLLLPAGPEWLNVKRRLMVTLEESGEHESVIAEGKTVTSAVNDDLTFTILGLAYRSIDDRKNAFEAFAAAVRVNPRNADAAAALHDAEAALKNPAGADPSGRTVH